MNNLAIGILLLLALMHSGLGELFLLRPVAACDWPSRKRPQHILIRILRIGWHLGSVAWISLAAVLAGVHPGLAVAGFAASGAIVFFVWVRGHPAWPLMAVLAFAGLRLAGAMPPWAEWGIVGTGVLVALGAAAIHVYWALGGRWGSEAVFPVVPGPDGEAKSLFTPPPLATAAVAVALLTLAGLMVALHAGHGPAWLRILLIVAAVLLGLRVVGEGRLVGLSKRVRDTDFARLDDALYTPLVALMWFGAMVALL